jgi:hypothetical protein
MDCSDVDAVAPVCALARWRERRTTVAASRCGAVLPPVLLAIVSGYATPFEVMGDRCWSAKSPVAPDYRAARGWYRAADRNDDLGADGVYRLAVIALFGLVDSQSDPIGGDALWRRALFRGSPRAVFAERVRADAHEPRGVPGCYWTTVDRHICELDACADLPNNAFLVDVLAYLCRQRAATGSRSADAAAAHWELHAAQLGSVYARSRLLARRVCLADVRDGTLDPAARGLLVAEARRLWNCDGVELVSDDLRHVGRHDGQSAQARPLVRRYPYAA